VAKKTGVKIKGKKLGDSAELVDATEYDMVLVDIRATVVFPYSIASPVPPDTGERQEGMTLYFTKAELQALLNPAEFTALEDAIATKAE
jgi:hypothetical protein